MKREIIDTPPLPEGIYFGCSNGHKFPANRWHKKCECGAEITGTFEKRIMKVDVKSWRGVVGSGLDGNKIKKKSGADIINSWNK